MVIYVYSPINLHLPNENMYFTSSPRAPKSDELIEVEPIIPPEAIVVVNTTNREIGPGHDMGQSENVGKIGENHKNWLVFPRFSL